MTQFGNRMRPSRKSFWYRPDEFLARASQLPESRQTAFPTRFAPWHPRFRGSIHDVFGKPPEMTPARRFEANLPLLDRGAYASGRSGGVQLLFFGGMWLSKTVQPLYFAQQHALDRFGAGYSAMALAGASSFLVGLLQDRWGSRGVLTVGTLLYAVGLALRVYYGSMLIAVLSGIVPGLGASTVLVGLRTWTFAISTDDVYRPRAPPRPTPRPRWRTPARTPVRGIDDRHPQVGRSATSRSCAGGRGFGAGRWRGVGGRPSPCR
jgi:hypothetical protein